MKLPSGIRTSLATVIAVFAASALFAAPAGAWEPTGPVELIVPAGTGGGADEMARFIQKVIVDHKLMNQPMKVVNKSGDSGMEALAFMKDAKGDPHKLVISLSNLFTAPIATGVDFNWRDITPVELMALDQFVLWVNAASPYKTAKDLLSAMGAKPPNSFKLGGTGSKQEDQIISVLLETAAATRIAYEPLKGGGDVAKALAAGQVDITVNNPIEGEKLWRQGALRPLCVFDGKSLAYREQVADGKSWADIPTCLSFGIPVQYLMMRGIFTTQGVTPAQVSFWRELLDKVRAQPEWKSFMARGAFNQTTMAGEPLEQWLDRTERFHRVVMREAKLTAASNLAVPASPSDVKPPVKR